MTKKTSSERIREILSYYEISQSEFCRRTGLDKSTVSLYINGKREPMQDKIDLIARSFNLDPAWVMGYDVGMIREQGEDQTEMVAKNQDEAYMLCTMREMNAKQIETLINYAEFIAQQNYKENNVDED